MEYQKICPICQKTFITSDFRRKYCNPDCKKIGYARNKKNFEERNPDYKKKKAREWYLAHKERSRELNRQSRNRHKEARLKYGRKYYREHKEEIIEKQRQRNKLKKVEKALDKQCDLNCFECPYEDCIVNIGDE